MSRFLQEWLEHMLRPLTPEEKAMKERLDRRDGCLTVIWVVLMVIVATGCSVVGFYQGMEHFKQEAVDNGSARYNPKTREFEWNAR